MAKKDKKPINRGAVNDPNTEERKDSGIVKAKYRTEYAKTEDSNGDDLAEILKGAVNTRDDKNRLKLDLKKLHKVAMENGIDVEKYVNLNNGQQRMTIGNMLRKIAKKEGKIKINGKFLAWWADICEPSNKRDRQKAKRDIIDGV